MQFCKECENKLFPIEEENKLWNKCIDCGFKEEYNDSIIDKKNYKNKAMLSYIVYVDTGCALVESKDPK